MKEALNLAGRLFLITAVAALVLGFANSKTAPVIEEMQAQKLAESLKVAYPEGENFEPLDPAESDKLIEEGSFVKEIYSVNSGEGHVYNVMAKGGYGGEINFIFGIKDGEIVGFSILSHSETPGFGAQAAEPEFAEGVIGVDATGDVGASESPAENEIHAISGSTITTTAITAGLDQGAKIDQKLSE